MIKELQCSLLKLTEWHNCIGLGMQEFFEFRDRTWKRVAVVIVNFYFSSLGLNLTSLVHVSITRVSRPHPDLQSLAAAPRAFTHVAVKEINCFNVTEGDNH